MLRWDANSEFLNGCTGLVGADVQVTRYVRVCANNKLWYIWNVWWRAVTNKLSLSFIRTNISCTRREANVVRLHTFKWNATVSKFSDIGRSHEINHSCINRKVHAYWKIRERERSKSTLQEDGRSKREACLPQLVSRKYLFHSFLPSFDNSKVVQETTWPK